MSKKTGLQSGYAISVGSGKTMNSHDGIKIIDSRPGLGLKDLNAGARNK